MKKKAAPRPTPTSSPVRTRSTKSSKVAATPPHPAFHRIHALLHTVRCISQHEDQLCILMHAMKDSPSLTPALASELRTVLDAMPAEDYASDLAALQQAITPAPSTARGAKKSAARKSVPQPQPPRSRR